MECYCEPQSVDGYCEVWGVSWPKAKKEHKCCECGETILPGSKYERIFYVFDGSAGAYKTCEFCAAEFNRISDEHEGPFVKGDLACMLVWEIRSNEYARARAETSAKEMR